MNAAALTGRTPLTPTRARPNAGPAGATHVAVGVDFLIEAAGGEAAVVRAASLRLARLFKDASAIEATDALTFALTELAPTAVEQLGPAAPTAISSAASALYSRIRAPKRW